MELSDVAMCMLAHITGNSVHKVGPMLVLGQDGCGIHMSFNHSMLRPYRVMSSSLHIVHCAHTWHFPHAPQAVIASWKKWGQWYRHIGKALCTAVFYTAFLW